MWNDRTALGSVPEPHNVVEEPYNSEKQNWVGDNFVPLQQSPGSSQTTALNLA